MSQLTAQDAGMQSRLNSMIIQFENQNEQHLKLIIRLAEMRDSLAGDYRKEVAKTSDCVANEMPSGIVPKISDCLQIQNSQISRFEALLNDLREYI
jgi:hypothetical protein